METMETGIKKPGLIERAKKAPLLLALLLLAAGISFAAMALYAGNAFNANGSVAPNPTTLWTNFDVNGTNQVAVPAANISSLNVSAGDTITANLTQTNTANNAFPGTLNITFNDAAQDYVGGEVTNVQVDLGSGPVAMSCGAATTAGISCTTPNTIPANSTVSYGVTADVAFAYSAADISIHGENN